MNDRMNRGTKIVIVIMTVAGVLIAMNQAFFWNPGGISFLRNSYLYFILACFLPIVFLCYPIAKSHAERPLPIYDIALAALTFITCAYLGYNGEAIITLGWDYSAPALGTAAAFGLWVVVLEALRRTAGLVVTVIALIFSLYPMIAADVPIGFMRGLSFDLETTAQIHSLG